MIVGMFSKNFILIKLNFQETYASALIFLDRDWFPEKLILGHAPKEYYLQVSNNKIE